MALFRGCPKPKHAPWPKTNADFWVKKLTKNKERDAVVTAPLQEKSWRVVRVWECDLARKNCDEVAARMREILGGLGSARVLACTQGPSRP